MTQYIDKDVVVTEIEKLQLCTMDEHMNFYSAEAQGEYNALSKLEYFLNTLEVKDVDEIIKNAEDHAYLAGQEKIIDKAIKWLEDNIDRYLYNTGGYGEYIPKCGGKMYEDFKKAMEE